MQAKVKKAFPGRADKEVKTRTFEIGEIIEGDLAAVAVGEGWAAEIEPENDDDPDTDATAEDVVAYLNGLDPAPKKKPKVADLSNAMKKKVTGAVLEAAWKAFSETAQ